MFPQGVFGIWLVIVNLQLAGVFSRALRWFGIVVGVGLILVGVFFVGHAIFVSTLLLHIPAAPMEEVEKIPMTSANIFLHNFIWIGSIMGVFTLPFWSILAGRRLLMYDGRF